MKTNALLRAIRLRREEIAFHDDQDGGASPRAKLLKHKKNLERTSRTLQGTQCMPWTERVDHACLHACMAGVGIYASMLVSGTENIPLGILTVQLSPVLGQILGVSCLQIIYVSRVGSISMVVRVSFAVCLHAFFFTRV